ncbi:restriction endonuclease [Halobacterium litoreum]|uniref:Restriction endonuclease n=1 Tax=Halobacterium litoreum TaxID=2039234 RepID=A0ABD5NGD9_9EURY|nr:restriction endonuclease [Halobacterium litoreum]UHH12848.1 restriction endonuclease [Halobacterium litoreum]
MFEDMSESAFPEFLAAFWGEKGWDASVTENDDGTYLVAGDKENGNRGLIGVRPSGDTEIGASEVEDFAAFCDKKGVDVRVMATRGRFTTGARSAADAGDVHLLDPNELASSVREEGAEGLVEEYAGGGGGGGSLFGGLPGLPIPVPSGVPSGIPVVPLVAAALVVAAAVFAGPTLLGFVPFVGGGGGGGDVGPPVTAMSLVDANESAGNVTTVRWDVRVQDSVSGGNYTAPAGETFVVVQTNVTASGSPATLRPEQFVLAVNGTNQPVREFSNASRSFRSTQLPVRVSPGQSSRAVLVFTAPEGFDGATLVETYDGPGVQFVRTDLAFDVE